MFQLENTYFIYAFSLIPLFFLVIWLVSKWRKKALHAFGDITIIQHLFPDLSKAKRTLKSVLYILAFIFLIIGLINPQVGTKLEEVKRKGADLMI